MSWILVIRLLLIADYTELGIGVKQDMDMAKKWYMRAAGVYWTKVVPGSALTLQPSSINAPCSD